MKAQLKIIPGSVTAPAGFLAGGVFCDIKRLGTGKGSNKGAKNDLALIVSETPAVVAGMFTTSQVRAAPVEVCLERMKVGVARAIVANSGNANACTGSIGKKDAERMAVLAAEAIHHSVPTLPKIKATEVLPASTGRIGVPLPMPRVASGIAQAAGQLGSTERHAAAASSAIMTSDTRSKEVAVEFKLGGKRVRVGAMGKGAGMIQPGMSATGKRPAALHATMLCFITTDASVERSALRAALEKAVSQSFNRVSVDGDMSTNDTVLLLANGKAGNPEIVQPANGSKPPDWEQFQSALNFVCLEIAKMIVRDGEGVHRVVTVRVSGAETARDAEAAARAVANSALVKTSWHGGDPNWGRIMGALGASPARVVETKIDLGYSEPESRKILWSVKKGEPTKATFQELCSAVAGKEFDLHIRLNLGEGAAVFYAADLTEAYVDFNKGDVSDPGSLGG